MNLGPTHMCKWCRRPIEAWRHDNGQTIWMHWGERSTTCSTVAEPAAEPACRREPDLADVTGTNSIRREPPADISWVRFETLSDGPPAAVFIGTAVIGLLVLISVFVLISQ